MSLQDWDKKYEDAEVKDGGSYERLPDGKYQVHITEVRVTTKDDGSDMVSWCLGVATGPLQGKTTWKHTHITEKTLGILKSDLWACDMRLEKLSDLIYRKDELLGRYIWITLKTKGEYQNTYFNGLVRGTTAPTNGEPVAPEPSGKLPF